MKLVKHYPQSLQLIQRDNLILNNFCSKTRSTLEAKLHHH
jgi:hypothetical protein